MHVCETGFRWIFSGHWGWETRNLAILRCLSCALLLFKIYKQSHVFTSQFLAPLFGLCRRFDYAEINCQLCLLTVKASKPTIQLKDAKRTHRIKDLCRFDHKLSAVFKKKMKLVVAGLNVLMILLTLKEGRVSFKPHQGFNEQLCRTICWQWDINAAGFGPPSPMLPLLGGLQRPEPGNWPALPWLCLSLLLSSFFSHLPAVARLTCKALSQKPVRALDQLWRLGQTLHSYSASMHFCLSLAVTTNKQLYCHLQYNFVSPTLNT